MSEGFSIYAVYWNPRDYPGKFVVRQWMLIDNCSVPVDEPLIVEKYYKAVQEKMEALGLYRLYPPIGSDPVLIEEWI